MANIASELWSGAYYTDWNDLNFCDKTTVSWSRLENLGFFVEWM